MPWGVAGSRMSRAAAPIAPERRSPSAEPHPVPGNLGRRLTQARSEDLVALAVEEQAVSSVLVPAAQAALL